MLGALDRVPSDRRMQLLAVAIRRGCRTLVADRLVPHPENPVGWITFLFNLDATVEVIVEQDMESRRQVGSGDLVIHDEDLLGHCGRV